MIWATVSSRSCFCGLYRASPSSAAKNINPISVLTIWWYPGVELSRVVGRGCLLWPSSLGKTVSLCPASFCAPSPRFGVFIIIIIITITRKTSSFLSESCLQNPLLISAAVQVTFISLVAQMIKNLPAMHYTQVQSLGQEDSLEGNGYPLQYSCLENPMDREATWATVHGVAKSEWLSLHRLPSLFKLPKQYRRVRVHSLIIS